MNKLFSEKINRLIKYGSPILWKRNSKKKDLEKIYKLTGFPISDLKKETNNQDDVDDANNISNISNKDSFSYNKLLYWKNSFNKIINNDDENCLVKEDILLTNQSYIDNENISDNQIFKNMTNYNDNIKNSEYKNQVVHQLTEKELNDSIYFNNINKFDKFKNRLVSGINKNKSNLSYESENHQNLIANYDNLNYRKRSNSPKISKEGKEVKFDSTINSFKDLKNIHESIVRYF